MQSVPLRVIEPGGSYKKELDPGLSPDDLLRIYRIFILTRTIENKLLSLQRQGRTGFYLASTGEEAASIGSALALSHRDWIFPAYRELGAALVRGIPPVYVISQVMGNVRDVAKGHNMPCFYGSRETNFVTPSAPIATQIPHAVGVALAAKLRGDNVVTLAYFGDGATSQNDFHTGMNFAGVFKAPVILFCRNNQYAISTPVSRQTAVETLASKASAYGFDGIRVDGNDVLAVYLATKQATAKARGSGGPTLIEALTYRLSAHSAADDPTRYQGPVEIEEWKKKDPLDRFKLYLARRGILSTDLERQIQEEVEDEVLKAITEAESLPKPSVATLIEDVYAEVPFSLKEQLGDLSEL